MIVLLASAAAVLKSCSDGLKDIEFDAGPATATATAKETAKEWCISQRPARPFSAMIDKAISGEEFPVSQAREYFHTNNPFAAAPDPLGPDVEVLNDAVFEGIYPPDGEGQGDVEYQVPAAEVPSARATALRLDAYCDTAAPR